MKYLILLLFISCASNPNISPELSHYVDNFFGEYKKSLDIQLGDEGNYYDRVKDHIRLKREDWDNMSPTFREMLFFHEAGHMILRRRHWNHGELPDGCPKSIMFWDIHENCYKKHKEYYIEELFSVKWEIRK